MTGYEVVDERLHISELDLDPDVLNERTESENEMDDIVELLLNNVISVVNENEEKVRKIIEKVDDTIVSRIEMLDAISSIEAIEAIDVIEKNCENGTIKHSLSNITTDSSNIFNVSDEELDDGDIDFLFLPITTNTDGIRTPFIKMSCMKMKEKDRSESLHSFNSTESVCGDNDDYIMDDFDNLSDIDDYSSDFTNISNPNNSNNPSNPVVVITNISDESIEKVDVVNVKN